MKNVKKILALLLCISLLFSSFFTVYANDSEDLTNLNLRVYYLLDGYNVYNHGATYDTLQGYFVDSGDVNNYFKISDKYSYSSLSTIKLRFLLFKEGILCEKEKDYTVKLDGIIPTYGSIPSETYTANAQFAKAVSPRIEIIYTDGSNEYVDLDSSTYYYNASTRACSVQYSFTPSKDVARIYYDVAFSRSQLCTYNGYLSSGTFDTSYYLITKLNKVACTFESEPKEVELLGGILGWIQNLYNNITGVVNGIGGLPANIWAKMSSSFSSIISNGGDILTSLESVLSYLQNIPSSIWNKMSSSFTNIINGNTNIFNEIGKVFSAITDLPSLIWENMSLSFSSLINNTGSIITSIASLPVKIATEIWNLIEEGLISLFVPYQNSTYSDSGVGFSDKLEEVRDALPFIASIMDIADLVIEKFKLVGTEEILKFKIDVPKLSGTIQFDEGEIVLLDFSWYTPYKEKGDQFMSMFMWGTFIINVYHQLPNIISGVGGLTTQYLAHDEFERVEIEKEQKRSRKG